MDEQDRPGTLRDWPLDEQIAGQIDRIDEVLQRRYGVKLHDLVETARWVRDHKQFLDRMRNAGTIAVISTLIGATLLAVWEGLKALARKEIG